MLHNLNESTVYIAYVQSVSVHGESAATSIFFTTPGRRKQSKSSARFSEAKPKRKCLLLLCRAARQNRHVSHRRLHSFVFFLQTLHASPTLPPPSLPPLPPPSVDDRMNALGADPVSTNSAKPNSAVWLQLQCPFSTFSAGDVFESQRV